MREDRTEVLIVGAGPVGLLTALRLAEGGIAVRIIDREERTATRSYACALHPRTLMLLDRLGLAGEILERGRRIQSMAFYDGPARQAEIKLGQSGGPFPCLVILPQNALESALERRLRVAGIAVNWNHRFDALANEGDTLAATVEELAGTATGYIVPHWEMMVKRRFSIHARLVVGADGSHSLVRQRLGVECLRIAGPEYFAAYEFESDTPADAEVRVVLDQATTNVLWPLPGNNYRWTFQLVKSEIPSEFPEKERRSARVSQPAVEETMRQYVQKVARQRAPWFSASVKEISWCADVAFEHRLAKQFGREGCWLAGDAAHQTGPVGAQSMNAGLIEADALADRITQVLRGHAALATLAAYDQEGQANWRRLLGITGGLKPRNTTDAWVCERRARILPCLPATGAEDLAALASQLGLDI